MLFSSAALWDADYEKLNVNSYKFDTDIAQSYILIMKQIVYTREAGKSLDRMQPKRKAAILTKLEEYARGEPVDIKKMAGMEYFRIRVGGDRVIIDDQGRVIMVINAGPRGGIYKE
jgi:mRNA interferase RelE/StbE